MGKRPRIRAVNIDLRLHLAVRMIASGLTGMDVIDLRYLVAAATSLNVSRAAQMLGLHASTISRRITRFEDELGITMFERGHHGLRLTQAGRSVMTHVQRALDDLEALVRVGRRDVEEAAGSIRLGVRLATVGEPIRTMLAAWRLACPGIELVVHEMNYQELRVGMLERRLDVVLVPMHALWPGVASAPVYRDAIYAALPTGHVLCTELAITWELLRTEAILIQEWEGTHTTREFVASLVGPSARYVAHTASKQSVLGLVAAGFGVTLATASQATVTIPGVTYLPIAEANAHVNMGLAWIAEREEAALGRFVAYMRDTGSAGVSSTLGGPRPAENAWEYGSLSSSG